MQLFVISAKRKRIGTAWILAIHGTPRCVSEILHTLKYLLFDFALGNDELYSSIFKVCLFGKVVILRPFLIDSDTKNVIR